VVRPIRILRQVQEQSTGSDARAKPKKRQKDHAKDAAWPPEHQKKALECQKEQQKDDDKGGT
jgi:hypothetical protein